MDLKKHVKLHNIQNVNIFKNMIKKKLHPDWYLTKIFCNNQLIFEVNGTQKELHIDIWSGNHSFYTGSQKQLDTEGYINKFEKKYNIYANNSTINSIQTKKKKKNN